jgi:nucleoside-diphosphate-sugar epimerase
MRLFVTGGTGVLGTSFIPVARAAGHVVEAPRHADLDLFDEQAVRAAVAGADAVLHLATRIPSLAAVDDRDAWHENDRLRAEASQILVDATLEGGVAAYIQPTVAFVYPPGPASEETRLAEVAPHLRSALEAEEQARRFAAAGGRGVVLRLGLLDGPNTGNETPNDRFGTTLHVDDAGLALLAALTIPTGVYNVCRDGERVSNRLFVETAGWRPQR